MQTDSARRTRICSPRWLSVALLAAISGCCSSSQKAKPLPPVIVREACLHQAAPTLDSIRSCLGQAQTGEAALDCLAQGVIVRDAWIKGALAECGGVE